MCICYNTVSKNMRVADHIHVSIETAACSGAKNSDH
jgi:hypothetical protein